LGRFRQGEPLDLGAITVAASSTSAAVVRRERGAASSALTVLQPSDLSVTRLARRRLRPNHRHRDAQPGDEALAFVPATTLKGQNTLLVCVERGAGNRLELSPESRGRSRAWAALAPVVSRDGRRRSRPI
jgi:hypothetical protein